MRFEICRGNYERLGVGKTKDSVTFSALNPKGSACSLVLYSRDGEQIGQLPMEPDPMKSVIWSVGIKNLNSEELCYNFNIDGTIVNDPYAEKIVGREQWADKDRGKTKIKCGFDFSDFSWDGDELPGTQKEDMVIYKLHVRGFSMGLPKNGPEKGTLAAVERRISYLKDMGVTTVEFMPVYEFEEFFALDESQKETFPPEKLNYWGYTRGSYFAPKSSYLGAGGDSVRLKQLIRRLHENHMECVLEFYFGESEKPGFVLEVLRYWAREYHVDGFHLLCGQRAAYLAAEDMYLGGRKLFYESFEESTGDQNVYGPKLFSYNDAYAYGLRKILNRQGGSLGEFLGFMRRQQDGGGFVNYVTNNNGFTLNDLFSYTEKKNLSNKEENQDGSDWNYSCNCGQEGPTRRKDVSALRMRLAKNALACVFLAQGIPLLWMGDECANSQQGNNNAYCQDNEVGWKGWQVNQKTKELYQYVVQLADLRRRFPMLRQPKPMQLYDYRRLGFPDLSYHGQKGWQLDFDSSTPCVGMMYNGGYTAKEEQGNGKKVQSGPEDAKETIKELQAKGKKEQGKIKEERVKIKGSGETSKEDYIYVGYNFSQQPQELALPALPHGGRWSVLMDTGSDAVFEERPVKQREPNTFSMRGRSVCLLYGVSGGMVNE